MRFDEVEVGDEVYLGKRRGIVVSVQVVRGHVVLTVEFSPDDVREFHGEGDDSLERLR